MKYMQLVLRYVATRSGAGTFKIIKIYRLLTRIRRGLKISERRNIYPRLWGNIVGQNRGVKMWGNTANARLETRKVSYGDRYS